MCTGLRQLGLVRAGDSAVQLGLAEGQMQRDFVTRAERGK
jgi:hypothetical protein